MAWNPRYRIEVPNRHRVVDIQLRYGARHRTLETTLFRKRPQRSSLTRKEFDAASVIYDDINDYIERTWSKERFQDAVNAFKDAVVIHDIAVRNSVVHTDYRKLKNTTLQKDKTILTHSPDTMTSHWVLSETGKCFKIKGKVFFEVVGDTLYPCNADIYHKEAGKYYVGYKNTEGMYTVYEKTGF